ncbi:MAG: hypothetical protein QS748_02735 [Candidatus Endonucleobacter bathymodioli]|uniref:Uncharacterized protein n=1 Tax=Candidatus Endonucleibacter bathymodioli TaxID=539814 RepID=A0AA90SS95_9GAMM|nr:hypothetical protein [Candidatus Endonucleobacter bathymodioli]
MQAKSTISNCRDRIAVPSCVVSKDPYAVSVTNMDSIFNQQLGTSIVPILTKAIADDREGADNRKMTSKEYSKLRDQVSGYRLAALTSFGRNETFPLLPHLVSFVN